MTEDTICAIATPRRALGIIKWNGPNPCPLSIRCLFRSWCKIPWTQTIVACFFGAIRTTTGRSARWAVVSVYRAPHSYTGEDSVNQCAWFFLYYAASHSVACPQRMSYSSSREYTQRAFLNNKMDLSQAEAVADLIASRSAATHRLAMNQMRGGFSKELRALRDRLLHFTSLVNSNSISVTMKNWVCQSWRTPSTCWWNRTRHFPSYGFLQHRQCSEERVPVAIIGETNAGKSTLLNALLHEDKAIVSDIQGTTRDAIEDTIPVWKVLPSASLIQQASAILKIP